MNSSEYVNVALNDSPLEDFQAFRAFHNQQSSFAHSKEQGWRLSDIPRIIPLVAKS